MNDHHFRHIPIIDSDGQATGIVSIKDIIQHAGGVVPGAGAEPAAATTPEDGDPRRGLGDRGA